MLLATSGRRTMAGACALTASLFLFVPSGAPRLAAQTGAAGGEWRTYGGDLGSTRYSPLDQITAANFDKLEVAWRFRTDALGPRVETNFQATPLMVGGKLFFTAGTRRAAVAVDAATGELLWMHSIDERERGAASPRQLSGRGLSYWSDGKEERILYVTPGYQMIALDAKTGDRVLTFGRNGIVDLKQEMDQPIDPVTGEIGLHAAPVIARDVIIIGAAHLAGGAPRSRTNVKGYKLGPLSSPPIVSRWEGPLAVLTLPTATGGANWQGGSFDPETKMLYIFSNTSIGARGIVPADPARSDFGWVGGTAPNPVLAQAGGRGALVAPGAPGAQAGRGAQGGRGAQPAQGRGAAPAGRGGGGGREG